MKNILKEIFIFVLIIAAIILILGVLLYDYIPNSKVIPTTIVYETPENLKAEIQEEFIQDNSEVILSYEINKQDLKFYQDKSSYVPGKVNPFNENNRKTGGSTIGDTSNGNNTVSDEEFFNNNKTK